MKTTSGSYYSRDRDSSYRDSSYRDSSYSESTRTPYIHEDESMMTYYSDESVERRQNKKLTYDTFVPMESDSSRGSTSVSGRRGWRKPGLSVDTRSHHKEESDDEEAEEAAKKTLSPGMADTENIRNIRRQRLARMNRNQKEDEENYDRRNISPTRPSRYMPSPIVEERSERGYSASPRKASRYGPDRIERNESPSKRSPKQYGSPSKRPYSGSHALLSPQNQSGGAFEPYKSPANMASPKHGKRSYNFDFEDDDESYNHDSKGGSSNETRASGGDVEDKREDQGRRYEADARHDHYGDDHRRDRPEHQDKEDKLDAKSSDDSEIVAYSSSRRHRYETKKHDESEKQDGDDRVEHRDGYERRRTSAHEQRDEAREDHETTPYNGRRSSVSPSKGRNSRRHNPSGHNESQVRNEKNDLISPTEGKHHHPSQNERWRYVPEQSPRESVQAHMAQAYMLPHGYQNPQYAAMANHNARNALMRRYGTNHIGPMRSPIANQFGPMQPPPMAPPTTPRQMQPPTTPRQSTTLQPSTPRQHASTHPPMPQQYQARTHTPRKKVHDDSGRGMSPMIEDRSYLSGESNSMLNASVNGGGAGCQAIQCQSVMTKIWTCGTIGDVDDLDPRTKILEGLAKDSMAFSMGAGGKPMVSKSDPKATTPNDGPLGIIGAFEKISAEAQFLGNEATHMFSDVINGNFNATKVKENQAKEPKSVKSYGDESSCSSDSSNDETHFDIGAPSEKKGKQDEKRSDSNQKKSKIEEVKKDATEPRSPSNGIYASVVKSKDKREQLAQLQKGRQPQAQKPPPATTKPDMRGFATGTDQLREVYKHLFDSMNGQMNPLYLENPSQKKNESSAEEVDAKAKDAETVFLSFDKDAESGTQPKTKSKAADKKKKATSSSKPEEEKQKAAVSGILSALENTLAQMMIPDSLSQANVEESVVGLIGGVEDESTDELDDIMNEPVSRPPLQPSTEKEAPKPEVTGGSEKHSISTSVIEDLLKKTQEKNALKAQNRDAMEEQVKKAMKRDELDELDELPKVETVKSMTDEDIEAELTRMLDDDSVASSPDNYDGPTDSEILAELMGGVDTDDGQDVVKSMFDDATVDWEDDHTDSGSLPSAWKPSKVHFSNEVSKLKIISEETSDDLESLKRAAKALEEAIKKASAKSIQRKPAYDYELPPSMSAETGMDSFATALQEEEPSTRSRTWLSKMFRK